MKKSLSLSLVGILATFLHAVSIDIGIKATKNTNEVTKTFKNINKSVGLTNFNSAIYTVKLQVANNDMECNSKEAKDFVENNMFESYNKPSFIGGYKALKKSESSTYCSVSYKDGDSISKKNYWIVKKMELCNLLTIAQHHLSVIMMK